MDKADDAGDAAELAGPAPVGAKLSLAAHPVSDTAAAVRMASAGL